MARFIKKGSEITPTEVFLSQDSYGVDVYVQNNVSKILICSLDNETGKLKIYRKEEIELQELEDMGIKCEGNSIEVEFMK